MGYWARVRWQLRRTCADEMAGDEAAVRAVAARILVNQDCAAGKHRAETDDQTGNEVCRFCKTVTDDYSDTGLT